MFNKKKEKVKTKREPFDLTEDIKSMSDMIQKGAPESSKYFNRLLSFLTNPHPENRIAACNALEKTAQEAAFTNISHWLKTEQDEKVISAMKKALVSIRKNINLEHSNDN